MLHVITGGSGSGKSVYGENILCSFSKNKRIYIATMKAFDEESKERIKRHQELRKDKGFTTIECYEQLKGLEVEQSFVLLECLSNLVANIRYQKEQITEKEEVIEQVMEGVRYLLKHTKELVIVTNEIFSDGVTYHQETMEYMQCLGEINNRLSNIADTVTEVVYGIPILHKKEKEIENEKII